MTAEMLVGTRGGPRARDAAVLELVNEIRVGRGLHQLRRGNRATRAATLRARHLAAVEKLAHDGWADVVEAVGLGDRAAGENIAVGYRDSEDVVRAWMNSPGHRANILSPDFRVLGVAAAIDDDGDTYWCQIFTSGP